jgi:hypothetical protein
MLKMVQVNMIKDLQRIGQIGVKGGLAFHEGIGVYLWL